MKIKLFVAREIRYFKLGLFSFNSYVYHLTRGFIASNRAFNLPARAFSLPTRPFNLATRTFSVLTREFELVTRGSELVTRVLLFHMFSGHSIFLITCMFFFSKGRKLGAFIIKFEPISYIVLVFSLLNLAK